MPEFKVFIGAMGSGSPSERHQAILRVRASPWVTPCDHAKNFHGKLLQAFKIARTYLFCHVCPPLCLARISLGMVWLNRASWTGTAEQAPAAQVRLNRSWLITSRLNRYYG